MMTTTVRPISIELAKKAATELFEDPSRIAEDLSKFREWIKQQPHLKSRTDDQFLMTFLRGCKYNLEHCKETLDFFYSIRNHLPEIFQNRNPYDKQVLRALHSGAHVTLPQTEHPDSPRVYMILLGASDASEIAVQDIVKLLMMVTDMQMLEDDNLAIAGQIGVLDLKNVTAAHLAQYTPTFLKQIACIFQEASPLRLKGFHYINTPVAFENVFNLFRTFLTEKNKNRNMIHHDMESLYKYVPQRLLPKEYGGEAGTIQEISSYWEKKISERAEFFEEDANYGVNEKKRIGLPKIAQDYFGIGGTFRKFNFD